MVRRLPGGCRTKAEGFAKSGARPYHSIARTATPLNSLRARILATAAPDLGHRIHEQSWSRLKNGPARLGADYGSRGSTLSGFLLTADSQKRSSQNPAFR